MRTSKEITEAFIALQKQLHGLASDLSKASERVTREGILPAEELDASLLRARVQMREIQIEIEALGAGLNMKAGEGEGRSPSLTVLSAWLDRISEREKALEEQQENIKGTNEIISTVLRIRHHEDKMFPALQQCHDAANELSRSLLSPAIPAGDQAAPSLEQRVSPFRALLKIVKEEATLDEDQCNRLFDEIGAAFGKSMALAAVRGKLIVLSEGSPGNKNEIVSDALREEPKAQQDVPEDGRGAGDSEAATDSKRKKAPAERHLRPNGKSDAKKGSNDGLGTGSNSLVDEAVKNYVKKQREGPGPATGTSGVGIERGGGAKGRVHPETTHKEQEEEPGVESTHRSAPLDVAAAGTKKETSPEPTSGIPANATSAEIAKLIIDAGPVPLLGDVNELLWQLIADRREDFAYHLARCNNEKWSDIRPRMPAWVLHLLVLGRAVRYADGDLSSRISQVFQSYDPEICYSKDRQSWNQSISLLLVSSSLRPAILAPLTGAAEILRDPTLREGLKGFNELYGFLKRLIEYADKNIPVDPSILTMVRDETAWEDSLRQLQVESGTWLHQAASATIVFAPATKVWQHWTKNGQMIHQAIEFIGGTGKVS